jgi:hypothetical protein
VHANAVWTAIGSPQPEFDNMWEIYLDIRDALRAIPQDETLQQVLSNVSTTYEPQNCLDEMPADLQPTDEEGLLVVDETDDEGSSPVVDETDDEGSGPVVDLTEGEDSGEDDGHGIGLDFLYSS